MKLGTNTTPAVQLSDRQEVEHRDEHSDPTGPGERVQDHVLAHRNLADHEPLEQEVEQRVALDEPRVGQRLTSASAPIARPSTVPCGV